MSRIRSKNTKPEVTVRSALHASGLRFRLHTSYLQGKPDIVLPKYSSVIFVHGCYWHRHKNCKMAYNPKSRIEFWEKKFKDNVKRFQTVKKQLKRSGWRVFVVWECQTKDERKLKKVISKILTEMQKYL